MAKKEIKKDKKDISSYPQYLQDMLAEGKALRKKTYAYQGYLVSPAGKALSAEKKGLMERQLEAMRNYSDILTQRVSLEEKEL